MSITTSTDDSLITRMIKSTRIQFENLLGQSFVNTTWEQSLDRFPQQVFIDSLLDDGVTTGKLSEFLTGGGHISLVKWPLVSVTFLKTFDEDDTEFTMPSTDYEVDTNSEPGRLCLRQDATWPSTVLRSCAGIQVRFVAGYGATNASVPQNIKDAITEAVAWCYDNRGCTDATMSKKAMAMLQGERIFNI